MRAKSWISGVAVLGVLVYAAAVVHHATRLTAAALQHQTLIADLAQLCHGGAKLGGPVRLDLPLIPQPTDGQGGCQICCGLGSAVALLAPERAAFFVPPPAALANWSTTYCAPRSLHAVCPPARAPPAIA